MRPRVKYHIIYRHSGEYPASVMCAFFEVSRSGYYAFIHRLAMEKEKKRVAAELHLHSDQGFQYTSQAYFNLTKQYGTTSSVSRRGNPYDNAVIENFFGRLKSELLYLQEFESMEQFKAELIDYLDYYNNRRIKMKLGGLPPAVHRCYALAVA